MASSLVPYGLNFTGVNKIVQGTTWKRTLTFSQDMSAYYNGALANGGVRATFKSGSTIVFETKSTGLHNVSFQWLSSTQLEVSITAAASTAVSGPVNSNTATYQVEVVNSSNEVQRLLSGSWEMDAEVVVASD